MIENDTLKHKITFIFLQTLLETIFRHEQTYKQIYTYKLYLIIKCKTFFTLSISYLWEMSKTVLSDVREK